MYDSESHNGPWMAVGDFNEIVAPDEITSAYFSSHRASLLATTLDDCELFDLKVTGRRYIWLHSDHCPILVRCHGGPRVKGSRPFRFQAAWATHSSYKHVISKAWNKEFGGVTERLKMVQQASLDLTQRFLEIFLCEKKSREQWVKYGDRNTKFFHLQTLVRRNYNRVHGLYVRDGSWFTDPDILQEEALSFYKNLFSTMEEVEVDCLGDVPMPTLSTEACARLIDPVSFAEVKSAVFSMSPFKAPGRYLGVNLNYSRTSRASFHSVIEKEKPWVALLRAKYLRNERVLDGPVSCNASHLYLAPVIGVKMVLNPFFIVFGSALVPRRSGTF
ncbi:uncharacterized protein [Arachis hypogaea]|uniref:uncharacterized protein n=1 Tax=Arachis hypogaea TaxID=3818 RepID=UPI003B2209D0